MKMQAAINQKPKKPEVLLDSSEEFAEFFIFPHEFISLACNASDRFDLMNDMYKPNFSLRKTEIFNINQAKTAKPSLESKKQFFYQVT
jgi:hypothetical protein